MVQIGVCVNNVFHQPEHILLKTLQALLEGISAVATWSKSILFLPVVSILTPNKTGAVYCCHLVVLY